MARAPPPGRAPWARRSPRSSAGARATRSSSQSEAAGSSRRAPAQPAAPIRPSPAVRSWGLFLNAAGSAGGCGVDPARAPRHPRGGGAGRARPAAAARCGRYCEQTRVSDEGGAGRGFGSRTRGGGGRASEPCATEACACACVRECVQPAGCDALRRSLRAGTREALREARSLADGVAVRAVGAAPWSLCAELVDHVEVRPARLVKPRLTGQGVRPVKHGAGWVDPCGRFGAGGV
jgi:hypothetical protein